jgi:hypothetical protein
MSWNFNAVVPVPNTIVITTDDPLPTDSFGYYTVLQETENTTERF